MNILIVKLSAIGDVIHTLPLLAALRKRYPDAHITWAIEEASADIITGHPCLDRALVSRRKKWLGNLRALRDVKKTIGEIRSFVATLRDRKYDLVVDFHGLLKSSIVVLLSGGRRRVGYDSMQELSGLFLNDKVYEDMEKHAVDRYLDLVRHLGADTDTPEFHIHIEEENQRRVEHLLEEHGINPKDPFVSVNPVALWDTKMWEDSKFAELCDRIVGELKLPVVFTGGTDRETVGHIRSLMQLPSVDLTGRTTLRDLAYLYERSSLVVTTDSGPMHVAAAVGTPTVALFGPTDPARTGPYGEGHTIVRKDLPCSPCFLKRCATRRCMEAISVEEVFQAVQKKMTGDTT
ncbi:MAG: lipopolysaccharide heptosyltransferase II [Deltaproteobacteria bacterium]|nr:lipopolysaccharide heptosyltransferase II [Deltaproteobacteria bacterium]